MNFHVLTLFPEMVRGGFETSITGRAVDSGLIRLNTVNIRDYAHDKHRHVDDYPYGGGAGMVMQAPPIYEAYCDVRSSMTTMTKDPRVIYVTPQGRLFDQTMAEELAREEELIILCGHYEGVDERVLEEIVTDYVSIGDYVLTGGELAAMVMMDAISRMVPGVLTNADSGEFESFHDNLLEYPQYTRPAEFLGRKVPDVLLSGHHENVARWRRQQSLIRTLINRPDLLKNARLDKEDLIFLKEHGYQPES